MKTLLRFLNSRPFSDLTHRLGAYLILGSNIILPLGLHRPWMRLPGWWLFPLTFSLAVLGALRYVATHSLAWAMLTWPWGLIFAFDTWLLAVAPVPTSSRTKIKG